MRRCRSKRAKQKRTYAKLGRAWALDHPFCEVCRERPASQIHHKAGRVGEMLNKTEYWLAVCQTCHDKITANGKWAIEMGYRILTLRTSPSALILLTCNRAGNMNADAVDSHILYRHTPEEVAALIGAAIPMAEFIKAVSKADELYKYKLVTTGKYFRVREARRVRDMLLRACKYARAQLGNYFPMMQAGILLNAQLLENATNEYWKMLQALRDESIPVH